MIEDPEEGIKEWIGILEGALEEAPKIARPWLDKHQKREEQ
jgi:hypothetical protein